MKSRISPQDRDLLAQYPWQMDRGYLRAPGGRRGVVLYLHRLILQRIIGRKLECGEIADHKNGMRSDNRRVNLRVTTPAGNSQNLRCGPFRGTTYLKKYKKWQAAVIHLGKMHYLGVFTSRKVAAKAAADKRDELGFLK